MDKAAGRRRKLPRGTLWTPLRNKERRRDLSFGHCFCRRFTIRISSGGVGRPSGVVRVSQPRARAGGRASSTAGNSWIPLELVAADVARL